jgi:glycosyltransferase involved in cell wall biosynthesis
MPEAMSCGLPVVAFNCPSGPANIITDGVDGFLILERDINSFANKLCQLIESIDLRKEMSQAAILSSQKYSANKIMGQWVDLFNELVPTVK